MWGEDHRNDSVEQHVYAFIKNKIPFWGLSVLCCLLASIFGCAEIPATNPFDPATPLVQRAPGRVIGHLFIEAYADLGPTAYPVKSEVRC